MGRDQRDFSPMSQPVSVSTLTVLMPFRDVDPNFSFDSILFALINTGANDCWLKLETSEDGVAPDYALTQTVSVPANQPSGNQGSIEIGPNRTRRYWRLSAYTLSPGFPTTTVKWKVTLFKWSSQ